MKPPIPKVRREIALVLGVSALALSPLIFLGFKSRLKPQTAPAKVLAQPVLGQAGRSGVSARRAVLSPDGRWIACMEIPAANLKTSQPKGALSALATDIVIRSARTGQEVFREFASGQFIGWVPQSLNFVAQNGLDITLFAPPPRKPGAPAPTQPWMPTPLTFPGDKSSVGGQIGAGGASIAELFAGAIEFSPDFRFAVHASWEKGDIWWQVADLTTLKIAAPVKMGRWLDYNPNIGGETSNIAISVAPATLSTQGMPRVAVLQITQPLSRSKSQSAPRPGATPKPTTILTPEQTQFLEATKRNGAKIQELYDRKARLYRNYGRQTASQVAQLDALIARRMRAINEGGIKAFTPLKNQAAALKRLDIPKTLSLAKDTKAFQIECFDLGMRRKLWSAPLRSPVFSPQFKFSPDGASVVVWNTARLFHNNKYGNRLTLEDSGIDFLSPATGKQRAAFRLYEADFSNPNSNQAWFYREKWGQNAFHSILALPDSRVVQEKVRHGDKVTNQIRSIPVARLFDTTLAREVGHIDLETRSFGPYFRAENFSTDDFGGAWLFGSGDFQIASRSRLGRELPSPLPRPTPRPTLISTPTSPRVPANF